jgi:hypothetical protein
MVSRLGTRHRDDEASDQSESGGRRREGTRGYDGPDGGHGYDGPRDGYDGPGNNYDRARDRYDGPLIQTPGGGRSS